MANDKFFLQVEMCINSIKPGKTSASWLNGKLLRQVQQDLNALQLYRVAQSAISMMINLAHFEPMWNYSNFLRNLKSHVDWCWKILERFSCLYFCQQTGELLVRSTWFENQPQLKVRIHICNISVFIARNDDHKLESRSSELLMRNLTWLGAQLICWVYQDPFCQTRHLLLL